MAERRWRVRLGAAAELDFANILKWTAENFGARQSRVYRDTLVQAIGELADGPDVAGSKARDEILPGLRTVHIARRGRRGSHFLMYRAAPERTIEIVRILHDRMDLELHDSPGAADRTIRRIVQAVETLRDHLHLGRSGRIAGTRELVIPETPYIVPYRVVDDDVQILAVIHGRPTLARQSRLQVLAKDPGAAHVGRIVARIRKLPRGCTNWGFSKLSP